MSRYDKYEPKAGGFRAPLENDQGVLDGQVGDANAPIGVTLTVNGRVVPMGDAAANTGLVGVLSTTRDLVAGDVVDIMTHGEIVEFGGTAGTDYYVDPTNGALTTAEAVDTTGDGATDTNTIPIGSTVEGGRLIVRLGR